MAEAQKNCKKGIPCGNTRISATKTCRIGTSSSTPRPRTLASPSTAPSEGEANQLAPADGENRGTIPSDFPWVGSLADKVYFRATCHPAQDLARPNRRYFLNEAEVAEAGYRRSRTPGC